MGAAETPTIGDSTPPHRLSVRYTPENPLLVDRCFARLPIYHFDVAGRFVGFCHLRPKPSSAESDSFK